MTTCVELSCLQHSMRAKLVDNLVTNQTSPKLEDLFSHEPDVTSPFVTEVIHQLCVTMMLAYTQELHAYGLACMYVWGAYD